MMFEETMQRLEEVESQVTDFKEHIDDINTEKEMFAEFRQNFQKVIDERSKANTESFWVFSKAEFIRKEEA